MGLKEIQGRQTSSTHDQKSDLCGKGRLPRLELREPLDTFKNKSLLGYYDFLDACDFYKIKICSLTLNRVMSLSLCSSVKNQH